ncbi:MAG: hypothetical protein K1X29_04870 [Bdellovibrionales bacterium]|nr:hypothetical protein [Bdellovibrionales bacterium]
MEVVQEFYPDRSGTHLLQLMIAHQVYLDQIAAYNEIVRKAVTSNAVIPPAPTPPPKTSGDPVFIPIPDNGATALQDGKKCSLDPQGTLIAAPSIMGSQIQIDDTEVSVFYISNPTTTSASGTKSNCRAQDHVRINPKDLYLFQQQVANNLESGTEQMKRKMQEVLINQPTEVDTTDTDVDKLTVCSGETNGTYSKWAFRLKDKLKQDFDLDVSVKHTNGSWQNIQYMQNGMCDFAIAQSDATSLFFSNLVEGEKPLFNIKSLDYFREAAFLICSKKSNLRHIQELFDTDRITISTGVDGSGSKITWDAIVSLIPNLKRLTTVSFNYSTALEKMKSTSDRDSVDCLFQVINKNSATFKDNIKMYLNQLSFIDFKNVNIDHDNSFNPFKIDSLYGYFESWFTDFPNIDTPVLSSQILMSTELEQTEDDETIDLRNTILKTIEDIKSEFN